MFAGVLRVRDELQSLLSEAGDYLIVWLMIDSAKLGTMVARPRVFILLIKMNCASSGAEGTVKDVLARLEQRGGQRWGTLLFPEDHELVRQHRRKMSRRDSVSTCSCRRCHGDPKLGARADLGEPLAPH